MPKKLIPHVYNTQLQRWVPCSSMSRTIKKPKATKTFKQVTKKKTVAKKASPKRVGTKKAPPKKVVAKKVVAKPITKKITPPAPKKACASPGA